MKIKFGIYSLFFLLLVFESSCISSKKVTYFQSLEEREGKIIDNIPSYRLNSVVRFRPDDIIGITVNVPGEPAVAGDYNLPLVPAATSENSTEEFVNQGMGRQAYLIDKDGTIDFPVIGRIKVAGYTQGELEKYLKEILSEKITAPTVITVRLLNFTVYVTGEVGAPGPKVVTKDNVSILEALALAGDMTIYGKRDDILLLRQRPDGGYKRISLDISREDIINSPYYFLQQNDAIYVKPVKAKAQSADISPMLGTVLGVATFAMTLVNFALMLRR